MISNMMLVKQNFKMAENCTFLGCNYDSYIHVYSSLIQMVSVLYGGHYIVCVCVCVCVRVWWEIPTTFIHSFSILSDDRSKSSSKKMPPYSAIQSLLLQMRISSPILKVIQ